MRFKRLLALLLAAALALAVLVGCGSGQQSAAQALLALLDGKYPNISIEIDPDLEADLRQAISQAEAENAGDDDAVIRAALETLLGSNITFRYPGEGQKGDTAFDLVFYAGSDPDKAAQAAYSQWNATFSNVPDDGQYDTSLAMVETNSGVWMLVKATVEKAGTVDKPDDDPEPEEPETEPYTLEKDKDGKVTAVTVNTKNGLQELFNAEKDNITATTVIKLTADTEYTVNTDGAPLAATFEGTLTCDGGKAKIELSGGYGLFNQIETGGTVENISINVEDNISKGYDNGGGYIWAGVVAGKNNGAIRNCEVNLTDITITGSAAGGIVGWNDDESEISGCTVTGGTIQATATRDQGHAGGIAGYNWNGTIGTDEDPCTVNGTNVSVNSSRNASAGGLVGYNFGETSNTVVNGSYEGNGTISATSTDAFASAGGLVGSNLTVEVSGIYKGRGTITATIERTDSTYVACAGGLVGSNYANGTVSATYTGSSYIEAKAAKETGGYYTATVTGSNPGTATDPTTGTIRASVGTKIGDNNNAGPVD